MPLTTIAFLVSYVAGCVGALRFPILGIMTYLLVYYLHPPTAWWGRPLEWMELRYSLVASIFTAIGIVMNWKRLKFGRGFWHRQEVLFVLFVGTMWLSTFSGPGPCDVSYRHLDKMSKMLIFVLMVTHVATDLRSYRAVIWAIVLGTFFVGYESFTAGPNAFLDGRLNNIGGPDFDRAPELGVQFSAALPFLGALLLLNHRWHARAFVVLCSILTVNGIVLTRTRSAMTAIGAGIAWVLVRTPRRWRIQLLCLGALGLVGAYSLTDDKFWDRMGTIFSPLEEPSQERIDELASKLVKRNEDARMAEELEEWVASAGRIPTWVAAWHMWLANPFGVGVGNFTRLIEYYPPAYFPIDAHNTIVLCLAELGILGGATFIAILIVTCLQIRRLKRMAASLPNARGISLQILALETSIVMFLVGGMTVSRLYCEMLWCLLALPICLERALLNAARLAKPATAPIPAAPADRLPAGLAWAS
jgi:putative inorganic carbon (HCO3(-)) transporter